MPCYCAALRRAVSEHPRCVSSSFRAACSRASSSSFSPTSSSCRRRSSARLNAAPSPRSTSAHLLLRAVALGLLASAQKSTHEIRGRVEPKSTRMDNNVVEYYQDCFNGLGFTNCEVPEAKGSKGAGDNLVPELDNAPFHWRASMPRDKKYCTTCCSQQSPDPNPDVVQSWNFTCPVDGKDKRSNGAQVWGDSNMDSNSLFDYEFRFATYKTFVGAPGQVSKDEVDDYLTRCSFDPKRKQRGSRMWGYHLTIHVKQMSEGTNYWRHVTKCEVEPQYGPDRCANPAIECDSTKCRRGVLDKDDKAIFKHCLWFNETITIKSIGGVETPFTTGTLIGVLVTLFFLAICGIAYVGGWIHCSSRGSGPD